MALGLPDEHIAHCVADAVRAGGPEADAKLEEAGTAMPDWSLVTARAWHAATSTDEREPLMTHHTFTGTVAGMTCGHCVASVTEELQEIHGVDRVEVDLDTGGLSVTSTHPLDEATVKAAIEEAGYQLA